jgi:hypothetical protein
MIVVGVAVKLVITGSKVVVEGIAAVHPIRRQRPRLKAIEEMMRNGATFIRHPI